MASIKLQTANGQKRLFLSKINNAGFTLIEIIIVIAIIAVLSSIGLASFVESSRNASLQTVQDKVISLIDVAKSRSLSQTRPTDAAKCSGNLKGYYVYFPPLIRTRVCLYAICNNSPAIANIDSGCENSIEKFDLPIGIEFAADPQPGPYYFPVLTGTIQGLSGESRIVIQGYGDKEKVVTVSPSGVVGIEKNE